MAERKKYKFSIIMPVYNIETFLGEAIDSVINQTIGFKKYIQLILIDDGSTDTSPAICKEYAKKYPNNITYVRQKNGGVSAARNRGLKDCRGEFVGFLDSDDKYSLKLLEKINDFVKSTKNIDIFTFKVRFFGAVEGEHPLNRKYSNQSKVIDLSEEYYYVHSMVTNTFMRRSLVESMVLEFDKRLKFGEDGKFINLLLSSSNQIGIVSNNDAIYYYRRRNDNSSAVNIMETSKEWYFDTLNYYSLELIDRELKTKGAVSKYVQSCLLYDLIWRFNKRAAPSLSKADTKKYFALIRKILKHIDDGLIASYPGTAIEYRIAILEFKHNKKTYDNLLYKSDGILYFKEYPLYDMKRRFMFNVDFITQNKKDIVIEGWYSGLKLEGFQPYILCDGKVYKPKAVDRPHDVIKSLGRIIYQRNGFKVTIPSVTSGEIVFKYDIGGVSRDAKLRLSQFTQLSHDLNNSYRTLNDKILITHHSRLYVRPKKLKNLIKRELKLLFELWKKKKTEYAWLRIMHWMAKSVGYAKHSWLVSDRPLTAGDNADYLFRYINAHTNQKSFFVLDKESTFYDELSKVGKVLTRNSFKHKLMILLAEKNVSSHFDDHVFNPFGHDKMYVADRIKSQFVFIGHGIMVPDLSRIVNRYNKNIRLITAAVKSEADSLLQTKAYAYDKSHVKVTGYPRFDGLVDEKQKIITIAPSWRRSIAMRQEVENGIANGIRGYSKYFKDTEYCKFYNQIFSDEKLQKCLEKHGYKVEFYIHPNHMKQVRDFKGNEHVTIMQPPHDYEAAMRKGALLLTDYSGVAFDFAYMKKPVIYTQFDKVAFYNSHTYTEGYFNFETHGFGPVTYDHDRTIEQLVKSIEEDCLLRKKYEKRINNFFYKFDQKNSERVYEAISKLDLEVK